MDLPVMPPVKPMLAKAVHELPTGDALAFEPKWDGFRCIVFRDGDAVELGSRNARPLTRYFPELQGPLRDSLPERCVVDGELVILTDGAVDFDALSQRIHPADSRVEMLAETTPARFVAFDLLALGDRDLTGAPFSERRALLEQATDGAGASVHVTPHTLDRDLAADWFARFEGAGFDGVMAKDLGAPYVQGKRTQVKVKHRHTADCVVAGFRWHKDGEGVGSLLLGLWGDEGAESHGSGPVLHHVGVATSFSAARRRELVAEVEPLRAGALEGHPWASWADRRQAGLRGREGPHDGSGRLPGAPSRWNATKDMTWEPLRCEAVVEVHHEGALHGRFRHSTRMVRWRPDKDPSACTLEQLEVAPPPELAEVFSRA